MYKISVIGGSGFIGSELIHLLNEEQLDLINIDKRESKSESVSTIIADITDITSLKNSIPKESSWLILLAAEHKDDSLSSSYYDVNVFGTKNVIEVMQEKGINKIIFTSSVAVYGLNKPNPDESFAIDPFNDYGKSKFLAEEELRKWYYERPEDRTLIIIRPTVVFGPRNRGNVYNLLKQIASGKFLMIGSGENKKSMAFVENMAAFIKFNLKSELSGYHLYNYSDKPDLSTKELVELTEKTLGKKIPSIRVPYFIGYSVGLFFDLFSKITGKIFPISSVRVKKFCATTQFDSSKIQSTGFYPLYSLEEGLSKTLNIEFQKESIEID